MSTTTVPAPFGWAGIDTAKRAWDDIGHLFPHFFIAGQSQATQTVKVHLWDAAKKVNGGQHLPTFYQQTGDCVSMGASNGVDYLSCVQIVQGAAQKYRPCYQPYIYGISRHQIGGDRLGYAAGSCVNEGGSVGVWAVAGLKQYGCLWADEPGVPPYSCQVATRWGNSGPPQNFIDMASKYKLGNAAKVTNYTQVRDAIANWYPVTVSSDRGFRMRLQEDKGKSWGVPSGTWGHQMCFIGVDDDPARPGCYCLNSWSASAFGPPADDAPPGGFWVDAEVVDYMVGMGDSFAISQFNGFPEQKLDFMLIGDDDATNTEAGYGDPSNMLIGPQSLKPQSAPFYRGPRNKIIFDSGAAAAVPQSTPTKKLPKTK